MKKDTVQKIERIPFNKNNIIMAYIDCTVRNIFEGIYVCVDDAGKELFDNGQPGRCIGFLLNDALYFEPYKTWGLHVIIHMSDKKRPEIITDEIDYRLKRNQVWAKSTPRGRRWTQVP